MESSISDSFFICLTILKWKRILTSLLMLFFVCQFPEISKFMFDTIYQTKLKIQFTRIARHILESFIFYDAAKINTNVPVIMTIFWLRISDDLEIHGSRNWIKKIINAIFQKGCHILDSFIVFGAAKMKKNFDIIIDVVFRVQIFGDSEIHN